MWCGDGGGGGGGGIKTHRSLELVVRRPRAVVRRLDARLDADRPLHVRRRLLEHLLALVHLLGAEVEERLLAQQQRRRLPVVAARALRRRLAELRRLAHVGDLLRDRHLQPRERELVELVLEIDDEGLVERLKLRPGALGGGERVEE